VRHDNENSNRENDDNWKNMKKTGGENKSLLNGDSMVLLFFPFMKQEKKKV